MKPTRIILITVDCLRASAIHCLGSQGSTENIDRMAENGVLFRNAVANGPGTPQSFPALFTSTYPLMHKGIILSPKFSTLAEILAINGFTCAGFHSNPYLSRFFKWNRGFETFQDSLEKIETTSNLIFKLPPMLRSAITKVIDNMEQCKSLEQLATYMSGFYNSKKSRLPYLPGEKLNELVIEWLKKCKSKKLFLWIHYMDPHSPYIPQKTPRSWRPFLIRKSNNDGIKRFYDLEVKYVDYCIGELVKTLENFGLSDDAIMILTADHGEGFGEHNVFQHFKHVLYDELIHVPLIFQGLEEKTEINHPIGLIDLPPTILDLLGIEKPRTFCGNTLLPLISREEETVNHVISESAHYSLKDYSYDLKKSVYSYRVQEWKFILNNIKRTKELYNLQKDPQEQVNLYKSEKKMAGILNRELTKHIKWERRIRILPSLRYAHEVASPKS